MATAEETETSEELILPEKYVSIPLFALQFGSRKKLSLHLDGEGCLNEDTGLGNNFQGLAELAGFEYLEIKNFERQKSPTGELLDEWTTREDLSPTFGVLWNFLSRLERFDVLTDLSWYIKRDGDNYLQRKARFQQNSSPIQDSTVTQSSEKAADHHIPEDVIMTVDDVDQGSPTMYDAFVCYNPEAQDLEFVQLLIEKLEVQSGLKLFVPWRDDLPGASHNTICATLIEKRCKRMVIILSPKYLQSSSCDFQTKFAHSLSPGSYSKKLVPILIEQCQLPPILRHITLCDYTKKDLLQWFWKRVVQTLKAPLEPDCAFSNADSLSTLSLDTSSQSSCNWSSSSSSSGGSSTSDSSSYSSAGSMSSGSMSSGSSNEYDRLHTVSARGSTVTGISGSPRNSPTHGVTAPQRNSPTCQLNRTGGSSPVVSKRSESPSPKPPPLPPMNNRPKDKIYYC